MNEIEFVKKLLLAIIQAYNKGFQDGQLLGKNKIRRRAFTKNTKKLVLLLQGYRCRSCGYSLSVYEFDHIDGNKANNLSNNCQALCPNCHTLKTRQNLGFKSL